MDVRFMDPKTAKLAIELQLADIKEVMDALLDDSDHDELASFAILQRDMQRQLELLEGQVLTLQVLEQEHEDRVTFTRLLEEEKQAVTDHQLALSLAGAEGSPPVVVDPAKYEETLCDKDACGSDAQWVMAKELYAAAFQGARTPQGARSIKGTDEEDEEDGGGVLGSKALTKCIACMEVVASEDTLTLDCEPEQHTYCRACLTNLFRSAIFDSSLFPPRCCNTPLPLDVCRALLPKALVKEFDLKVEELATPNPTYCSNAECAKFIMRKDIKDEVGNCVYCRQKTCISCKQEAHNGLCPHDPHVQLLMDVAKRSKWQQCQRCNNMVELTHGCFHMTYAVISLV